MRKPLKSQLPAIAAVLLALSAVAVMVAPSPRPKSSAAGPARAQAADASPDRIRWFREARFGMFIHWGAYSQLGREEWARQLLQVPLGDYQEMAKGFNPVRFDPDEWVALAKDAGVRYMVVTSKHHDGFCMFDSRLTDFDVAGAKYGRDALRMLTDACRRAGMPLGFYYSIMDWNHPDYLPRRAWETDRPVRDADFNRYMDYAIGQVRELATGYDPAILWFDGEWEHTNEEQRALEIERMLRSIKPDILINDRLFKRSPGLGDFGTPENYVPATGLRNEDGTPRLWEACYTMNFNGWGFNRTETEFHSAPQLIRQLVEIASKGGNFLLNVGPGPDGRIPPEFAARLKRMGEWLRVYGDSVYGTSASVFEKLPFFGRCTVKGNTLYIHVFGWPADRRVKLPGLRAFLKRASMMDTGKTLNFRRSGTDIIISLPDACPDEDDSVVVVELQGKPDVAPYAIEPGSGGRIELPIVLAEIQSEMGQRAYVDWFYRTAMLSNWQNVNDYPAWEFTTDREGTYEVQVSYASQWGGKAGYVVQVDDQEIPATTKDSPSVYFPKTFPAGTVDLPAGKHTLKVRITSVANNQAMRLEKVTLLPLNR